MSKTTDISQEILKISIAPAGSLEENNTLMTAFIKFVCNSKDEFLMLVWYNDIISLLLSKHFIF